MIVVVAADGTVVGPFPDVAPEVLRRTQFQVSLTGGDGSQWDLTKGDVLLAPGAQLFTAPETTHFWQESSAVDGARFDGMRTPKQDRVVPVFVLGDDWQTWRDTDSAFFRAIHPLSECLLTVTAPDATSRSLGLRFTAGGEVEVDPLTRFYAAYTLEFTAANPFWRGDPVSYSFEVKDAAPLFPGPPFNINRSSTTSDSTVNNPGDEPVWPRYTIVGPADSWSVGVGKALVSSDTPLLAGQTVTIDTDRTQLTVLDEGGVNVYGNLDDDTFAPIPPGVDVPLSMTVAGFTQGSRVQVDFTPLYRRPW